MYIRVKHNGETCYYYLCKTQRIGHKVQQIIVQYFGKVVPNEYQHMLKPAPTSEAPNAPTETTTLIIPDYTIDMLKELEEYAREEMEWLRDELRVEYTGE